MSEMKRPEMKVVRFKEADVIVASGSGAPKTMSWTKFGDGNANNGVVKFNETDYIISSSDAITDLLSAMGVKRTAGIEHRNGSVYSIDNILGNETKGTGVSSKNWNTTYYYDANATWNNGSQDIKGVFYRQ